MKKSARLAAYKRNRRQKRNRQRQAKRRRQSTTSKRIDQTISEPAKLSWAEIRQLPPFSDYVVKASIPDKFKKTFVKAKTDDAMAATTTSNIFDKIMEWEYEHYVNQLNLAEREWALSVMYGNGAAMLLRSGYYPGQSLGNRHGLATPLETFEKCYSASDDLQATVVTAPSDWGDLVSKASKRQMFKTNL